MAADFIKVVEEGMEKSKTTFATTSTAKSTTKKSTKKTEAPAPVEEVAVDTTDDTDDVLAQLKATYAEPEEDVNDVPFDIDDEPSVDELMADIRAAFKTASADVKKDVKAVLTANGSTKLDASLGIDVLKEIMAILQ
jgi:hypothetical protein